MSTQHREGLARLLYIIEERKLGGVLSGPYGVGKSMVLELLEKSLASQPGFHLATMSAPPAGGVMVLAKQILTRLNSPEPVYDVPNALMAIQDRCNQIDSGGAHVVLILDETQLLRESAIFEFLHLLVNLRAQNKGGSQGESLITLILAGHSDIRAHLAAETALCQRIQIFWELEPLDSNQTSEYIHHRMRAAGGDIWVFEEECIPEIHRASGGLPRLVNNICDLALLLGYASGVPKVSRDIVLQAIKETNSPAMPGFSKGNEP
jgi:type II secretory pathway predicted ATPase ExeA